MPSKERERTQENGKSMAATLKKLLIQTDITTIITKLLFILNKKRIPLKSTRLGLYLAFSLLCLPSVKQASGSRTSSGSASGCSPSGGSPISTVLPSDELDAFNFCEQNPT